MGRVWADARECGAQYSAPVEVDPSIAVPVALHPATPCMLLRSVPLSFPASILGRDNSLKPELSLARRALVFRKRTNAEMELRPPRPSNIGTTIQSKLRNANIPPPGTCAGTHAPFPVAPIIASNTRRKGPCLLDVWNKRTLKSLAFPGGLLLLGAVILLETGRVPPSALVIDFY